VPSVVVVGAGLAGLCCGWRLQRAGFDVEVLEAAAHVGGRLRTQRVSDFLVEPGIASFTSHDRSLHSVFNSVELASKVRSVSRFPDAVTQAGTLAALRPVDDPLLFRSQALSAADVVRLLRLRIEWMRWRKELDFSPVNGPIGVGRQTQISNGYARLEAQTLSRYLDQVIGPALRKKIVAPLVSHALGLDAENISAAYLLVLINRVVGARPQYLAGGLDQVTSRLAAQLPVRTSCKVTSLETQSDGARVRYRVGNREGSVVADSVVVALPGTRVADICPKITPSERGFFEDVRYARSIDVHLMLGEPTNIGYRSICFPRRRGLGLYGVQVADIKSGAVPVDAGMLRATLGEATTERAWQAGDADIETLVRDNLSMTPIGRIAPVRTFVSRHSASAPVFYPSYLAKLARFNGRLDRTPRLAFCGDYLAGNGAAAALKSGMRAASQIAHGLA
jgi:protoporphyrinogen/coproporphyrinogen III oxidase